MSAVAQATLPDAHLVLRSAWRKELPIRLRHPDRWRRKRHALSVLQLISHLGTTALVLVSLIILTWMVSWALQIVHSIHPIPDKLFEHFVNLEIALVYLDTAASCAVLLVGLKRYIFDVIKGDA